MLLQPFVPIVLLTNKDLFEKVQLTFYASNLYILGILFRLSMKWLPGFQLLVTSSVSMKAMGTMDKTDRSLAVDRQLKDKP